MQISNVITNVAKSLERWNQFVEHSSFSRYLERSNFGRIILMAVIIVPIAVTILCLNALVVGLLSFPFMCAWNWAANLSEGAAHALLRLLGAAGAQTYPFGKNRLLFSSYVVAILISYVLNFHWLLLMVLPPAVPIEQQLERELLPIQAFDYTRLFAAPVLVLQKPKKQLSAKHICSQRRRRRRRRSDSMQVLVDVLNEFHDPIFD